MNGKRQMVDAMVHPHQTYNGTANFNHHFAPHMSYRNSGFQDVSSASHHQDDDATTTGGKDMDTLTEKDLWDAQSDVSSSRYGYSTGGRSTFKAPPSEPDSSFSEVMGRSQHGHVMPDFSKREVIGKYHVFHFLEGITADVE